MKQKIEKVIRSKKVAIALMEFAVAIGCILIFCLFMVPKDRIPDTTHSYSKVEKVTKYKVEGNYMTRVMPLTDYKTFKEIAENTLNNILGEEKYTVKVYLDAEKTQEVTSGYIASGMIVEGTVENESRVRESTEVAGETEVEATELVVENEEEKVENGLEEVENDTRDEADGKEESEVEEDDKEIVSYRISVIGDMTKDGDINVTELTKTIKCVIGLSNWSFTEEEKLSADLNEDGQIDITDIETCINYIVFGELDIQEKEYTVTFKNYDGTVISTKTDYHYGDTIEIPDDPTRESDEIYIYKFSGWSPEIAETEKVTKDAEYVATYKAIEDKSVYKVEHYKEELDGTYILAETENLEGTTGEEVTAIAKTYEGFTEDQRNSERKATGTIAKDGSLTLKLYYNRNAYTVTFKNYDGSIVGETKEYFYGQTVSVPDSPTRKADETYTYEFSGWSPEVVEKVTENAEYMAQYTETYIEYSVMFKDYDGTVISEKTDYHYGDTVEVPESPMREADDNYEYEFAGWKKEETEEIGVTVVKKDEEYIATYQEIAYKILIEREDGTLEKYVSFEKAFATITDENIKIQLIGDVTESITISESKNITLDLNNHKITSNQTSTITNNGNLLIVDNSIEKEGMIENTENTVIINNRSLTLGYDDGVVEENILIKGQTTAIQNNNNFYMYDGTLMGKNTITGNNAIIPEGEEYGISIREENGIQIATIQIIEIPQALVGETYYTTLQQAIDENNNEIIYVVKKNIELIDVLTIDETKNLTIDLNGNSITKTANTGYVIRNAGTLTITNTNESNKGTIISTTGSAIYNDGNLIIQNISIDSYSYGVYNQKDLTIEDVNIKSNNGNGVYNANSSGGSNFNMIRGNIIGSVANYGNITKITDATINGKLSNNTSNAILELMNVTMKSSGGFGISLYGGISNQLILKNSKVDIENGRAAIYLSGGPNVIRLENTEVNIIANDLNQNGGGIYCSGEYNIIIDKNTKITSTNISGDTYGIYSDSSVSINSSIQLIDGTISAYTEGDIKYRVAEGVHLNSGYFDFLRGSVNGTTETISATIRSIAEGKQIQTVQEENKYVSTLVDAISTNYVASIGEEKYYSLKEAIAACENTEEAKTITMLADYEQWESINISEQKNIILDLNGHKIIAHSEFLNEGQFEVTDTSEEQTGTIEEKTGRAILNKENGIFTLSGGTILLNSTTLSKCAIYNTDQASINMKGGTIEVNNSKTSGSQYMIYNISTGNIQITEGELKGNITSGSLIRNL